MSERKKERHKSLREKLQEKYPDLVSGENIGGCCGCPGAYWDGYPEVGDPECKGVGRCEECWNEPYIET